MGGISSGVAGLAGAGIGGGVTLAGTLLSTLSQRGARKSDRQNRLSDSRREATTVFMTRVLEFMDTARDVTSAIEAGFVTEAQITTYRQAWSALVPSLAAVQVAGPKALAEKAKELREKVGDYGDLVDARLKSSAKRRPPDQKTKHEAVWTSRNDFLAAAHELFG